MRYSTLTRGLSFATAIDLVHEVNSLAHEHSHDLQSRALCKWPTIPASTPGNSSISIEETGNYGSEEPDSPTTPGKREVDTVQVSGSLPRLRRGSGEGDNVANHNNAIPSWEASISGGRDIWSRLQTVLNMPTSEIPPAPCLDFSLRWKAIVHEDALPSVSPIWYRVPPRYTDIDPADPSLPPDAGDIWQSIELLHPRFEPALFWYHNLYSPRQKIIVAGDLQAFADVRDTKTGALGRVRAPDRWSDVTWAYWVSTCASDKMDPATLGWVLQQSISNGRTRAVMKRILSSGPVRWLGGLGHMRYRYVKPSDGDDFFALLRTPNVIGTVHMLMQYVLGIERKTIKGIGVTNLFIDAIGDGEFHLAVELMSSVGDGGTGTISTS